MKTLKKIEIKPEFVKYIPTQLEPNVIYISKEYGCAVHTCLCGCGTQVVMTINNKFDTNCWNLIEKNGKVSFTPSIFEPSCPNFSHYVITDNIANVI